MAHYPTDYDRAIAKAEREDQGERVKEARENHRLYKGHAKANEKLGRQRILDRERANRPW